MEQEFLGHNLVRYRKTPHKALLRPQVPKVNQGQSETATISDSLREQIPSFIVGRGETALEASRRAKLGQLIELKRPLKRTQSVWIATLGGELTQDPRQAEKHVHRPFTAFSGFPVWTCKTCIAIRKQEAYWMLHDRIQAIQREVNQAIIQQATSQGYLAQRIELKEWLGW